MAKSKSSESAVPAPPAEPAPLSFEQSLAELQTIVGELEEGELGLEASLVRFERGIGLLRGCYQVLDKAEHQLEVLCQPGPTASGSTVPGPTAVSARQSDSPSDTNESHIARSNDGEAPPSASSQPNSTETDGADEGVLF